MMKLNPATAMLYLCGCVLSGEQPDPEWFSDVSRKALYEISQFHGVTALVCEGLEQSGVFASEGDQVYWAAFRQAREKAVRKNLMLDIERTKILAFLERRGIWYMPLKGVLLKDLYPKMGLRQMSDNDILFDKACRNEVRDWFCSEGFMVKGFGNGSHDVYLKEPVYNYEMHVSLFDQEHLSVLENYYRNVKDRLIKDPKNGYGYHFSDEDFYIYFLCHGYRHFSIEGTGVRFLFDLYLYRKHRPTMDFAYIGQELRKLGLEAFEQQSFALISTLFRDMDHFDCKQLKDEQKKLLQYFLTSGTYGTVNQRVSKDVDQYGKYRYLLMRLFPGTDILQNYHPIFRHPWLMPIGWLYRAVSILTTHAGYTWNELRIILKTKQGDSP